MTTVGIIGSGHIGSNVARAAIAAGHDVVISNSRGPESLTELVAELGPNARAATVADAAASGELVLVAIPLGKIGGLSAKHFADKIVIDANNYYPQRDGHIAALDSNESTVSELLQAQLPDARVVKGFNNIRASDIPADGMPTGSENRRALPIASNDADAMVQVGMFFDSIGFDAVPIGDLSQSWLVERDTPAYVTHTNVFELHDLIAHTTRVQQI